MNQIFTRTANTGELSEYWDAVEAGEEYEPFCTLCDELIETRENSVEIFFRENFSEGETIDSAPDYGLAAHKRCVESELTAGTVVEVPKW